MQYSIITLLATAASLTSATITSASATQTPIGAIVPVGSNCDPKGTMCALGASCYAVNSGLQTVCGNFQASCTSDQQCAFNTCNNGFCNGLPTSRVAGNGTATGSMNPTSTGSGSASKTSGLAQFTGAAAANMVPEFMAVALGVAAWAL
jgi:hypothetical protein